MSNLNQMKAFNKRSSWLVQSIEYNVTVWLKLSHQKLKVINKQEIKQQKLIEFRRDFDGKTLSNKKTVQTFTTLQ